MASPIGMTNKKAAAASSWDGSSDRNRPSLQCQCTLSRLDDIRLDHYFVLIQCTENSGCFPWGKQAAIAWRYPGFFLSPVRIVFVFPYHRFWGLYSFMTDGYGIFNLCRNLGVHTQHGKTSDVNPCLLQPLPLFLYCLGPVRFN